MNKGKIQDIPAMKNRYQAAKNLLDRIDESRLGHGGYRGTFDSAIAEAQGFFIRADDEGGVFNHVSSLDGFGRFLRGRIEEMNDLITACSMAGDGGTLGNVLRPVKDLLNEDSSLADKTLDLIRKLQQGYSKRLAGKGHPAGRTEAALVSNRLKLRWESEEKLLPSQYRDPMLEAKIAQLPLDASALSTKYELILRPAKIQLENLMDGKWFR
jgi:hypothetical protein